MADKSYESYEMLAKLLSSGRKENIDSAYDALSDVINGEYVKKKLENADTFEKKRNALAANKAKAEKYLDYFMTEKGYDGSGIEADAKLKANIGYNSDLASLHSAEAAALSDIESDRQTALLKNEAERNEKKAAADKDISDTLYKAYSDDADRALKRDQLEYQRESDEKDRELKQNQVDLDLKKLQSDSEYKQKQLDQQTYLKEKEYEIKMLQAQTDAAKAAATTTSQKEEAESLKEKLSTYRQLLYQELKNSFDLTDDINEKQRIYDSVTGVNAERATEIYGESLYKSLIKDFSKALNKAKAEKADAETIRKLYDRFVNAKDEYHYQTYMKLKRELEFSNFPGFTADQLERAYKAYLKNGQVS